MVSVPKSELDHIKLSLTELSTQLTTLNHSIIGNKAYGQVGLVERVDDHEKYIEDDKKLKNRLAGGMVLGGLIWSYLLKVFFK